MRREAKLKQAAKDLPIVETENTELQRALAEAKRQIRELEQKLETQHKAYDVLMRRYQKASGATKHGDNTERPDTRLEPAL